MNLCCFFFLILTVHGKSCVLLQCTKDKQTNKQYRPHVLKWKFYCNYIYLHHESCFHLSTVLWSEPKWSQLSIFCFLSTTPSLETQLTQQPPVPVQINTLYPQLFKAAFHLCISRPIVILWTGWASAAATLSPHYTNHCVVLELLWHQHLFT